MSASAAPAASPASGEAVAAFLRENPSWLAEHPDLYLLLAPPVRVHGEGLADHMAAMVREARARADTMAEQAHGVLAAGRAAAGLAARVYEAVLALMRAPDPADCVAADFPALLAVDAACLCVECSHPRMRAVPAGTVAALLGGRAVVFRDAPADAALLHAEAAPLARHDVLVRVGGGERPALLAPALLAPVLLVIAARERCALDPGHGAGALAFLGRAVAAALER